MSLHDIGLGLSMQFSEDPVLDCGISDISQPVDPSSRKRLQKAEETQL